MIAPRTLFRRTWVSCAALLVATVRVATAQDTATVNPHAVQPERPTVATHAGTVARGWLEIESGLELDRVGPNQHSLTAPTVVKLGLRQAVQLNLFVPVMEPAGGTTGAGDFAAGIKWRLVDDAPVVGDFAVMPIGKVATGSTRLGRGTGTNDVSVLLISSHSLGPVSMDLNAGYTRRSGNGTGAPRNATVWTASFGAPAVGPAGWVAEVYGFPGTGDAAGQPPIVALLFGPTFLARSWLALDAGAIIPLRGPQAHALYVGTVYNVGRLWRSRM